jgi:hypothetical protein
MNGHVANSSRPASLAIELLDAFAERTGLTSTRPPRRYLWTDAFAVCGWLGLHQSTNDQRFLDLALRLVDQVHHTLGRHRADDERDGWISGLGDEEGEEHPTAGGLRIGKTLPERSAREPYQPNDEWNRDGQYYHYLTRWMHALNRVWRVTGEPRYHRQAVELARAAHRGFVRDGRMVWKMNIDLERPLVPSRGQHDPLDGRIAIESLRATAPDGGDALLAREAAELDTLCHGQSWVTNDALGTGGLLIDCLHIVQLRRLGRPVEDDLARVVFRDAVRSLEYVSLMLEHPGPADQRLAFRELGLALGLRAAARLAQPPFTDSGDTDEAWIRRVERHQHLATDITSFWSQPANRSDPTWTDHWDIGSVMLAVTLAPAGYLDL